MRDIGRLFDGIARRYDLLNHLFSFGIDSSWRETVVSTLPAGEPARILDCCTGTGDQAIALARAFPGARITGIDLSHAMIAVGERKIARRGLGGRVSLSAGDVQDLVFDEGSFDLAVMSFGLRNLGGRRKALESIRSVLKPGGVLRILEFSPVPHGSVRLLYGLYRRFFIPAFGGLVSGSGAAYRYLSSSIEDFPDESEVVALLGESGFTSIRAVPLSFGIVRMFTAERP